MVPLAHDRGSHDGLATPLFLDGMSWLVHRRLLETGQRLYPCSAGWTYDANIRMVQITGGGEVSARVVNPPPLGIDPSPRAEWPQRAALHGKGWRAPTG